MLFAEQHLKALGPGHRLGTEVLAQSEAQRQLGEVVLELDGVEQMVLVQHFMVEGSLGQAPEMEIPLESVQSEVEMQTPVRRELVELMSLGVEGIAHLLHLRLRCKVRLLLFLQLLREAQRERENGAAF